MRICQDGKAADTSAFPVTGAHLQCVRSSTADGGVPTGIRRTVPVADVDGASYIKRSFKGTDTVDSESRNPPRRVAVSDNRSKIRIRVACFSPDFTIQEVHVEHQSIQRLPSFEGDELSFKDSRRNPAF